MSDESANNLKDEAIVANPINLALEVIRRISGNLGGDQKKTPSTANPSSNLPAG